MADLFALPELAAYLQVPALNEDAATLLLELATDLIADAYGAVLPDPPPPRLKRIALEVVKRAYLNPNGYVSESFTDYSYNRGAGNVQQSGIYLTDAERAAIRGLAGLSVVRTVQLTTPFDCDDDLDWDSWA